MTKYTNVLKALRKYKGDESGTLSLTWSLSLTTMLIAVGAAYDFTQLSSASSKAQAIADNVALAAAVYITENGGPPTNSDEGYVDGHVYNAAEAGFNFDNLADGGSNNVTIKADYDLVNNEVVTTVTGKTNTAFMNIIGAEYTNLDFKTQSKVKYASKQLLKPVSVFFVLDYSRSMSLDDRQTHEPNPVSRAEGLEASMTSMMYTLGEINNAQPPNSARPIRTALAGFNDQVNDVRIAPSWNLIPQADIDAISESLQGRTRPTQAMQYTRNNMLNENAFHRQEQQDPNLEAQKFTIYMTDGRNTEGTNVCETVVTSGYFWVHRKNGKIRETAPNNTNKWDYVYLENVEVEECENVSIHNAPTLEACSQMKNEGVTVFTIGYALEPGDYYNRHDEVKTTSEESSRKAYEFLEECASPDSFFPASDSDRLNDVFENIGSRIAETVVRISE